MKTRTALLTALLLLASAPAAEAQIYQCGVVDVIFLNPDLNARAEAGIIEANGAFFAQFQVVGERAEEVEYIGFSFGKDPIGFTDDQVCPDEGDYNGYYFSGQQIINYRADLDPSDGFFINLQTALVPDGDYSAAVHAFDENDNELGRFWANAVVENCSDQQDSQRCGEENADVDETQPWPIVLPGDGAPMVDGFTIEVAEELSEIQVLLNGVDISDELVEWDGRLWDDDLKPGYGPFGAIGDTPVTAECNPTFPTTPQLHECSHLGVAYEWTQRKLVDGDVLNVRVVDMFGNEAKKDVHVGFGITGGISSGAYPILQWQADHVAAEVEAGDSETFTFTIQNLGTETGHPFSDENLQVVPEGWEWEWTRHQPVQSGESTSNDFTVTVPVDAESGRYQVTAGMRYDGQNNQRQELQQILNIDVTGGQAPVTVDGDLDGDGIPDDEVGSPGVGVAVTALVLLGAAMVAVRRRQ